eukprot:Opistho-1_new@51011
MHRMQMVRLADHLARHASGLFVKHHDLAAHHARLNGPLLFQQKPLHRLQPRIGHARLDCRFFRRRRAGAGRILEAVGLPEPHRADQIQRIGEIGITLTGEAHDEIGTQQDVGPRRPDALDHAEIGIPSVLAVHRLQYPVRPRLHRQMQIGHQLRLVAMRGDQVVFHVVGVARRVADALQPVDPRQRPHQPRKAPVAAFACAMIGVHVLTQQRDLLHALFHQPPRLGQQPLGGAAHLGPARIGHHAEGAELVAAFLHRQKGRRPAQSLALGQVVELVLDRKLCIDRLPARQQPAVHLGQAVVALRPHHQIDQRHPAHDLVALGLRHAARHADLHIRLGLLEGAQPPQIGIELLRRLLADVAGVQQHHVGVLDRLGRHIALGAHGLDHALAVIDIHLAAISLDEQLLRLGHDPRPIRALENLRFIYALRPPVQ